MNAKLAVASFELARELVEHGWTQGAYVRSPAGWAVPIHARAVRRVCAAGAIDRVGWVLDLTLTEREELRALAISELGIGDETARNALALERWNDDPDRTKDDVLALYDRVLERARNAAA